MRKSTQSEKRYMSKVAGLGCIINYVGDCNGDANIHHIKTGYHGRKAPHHLVFPLCRDHHQGALSIHSTPRQFEKLFGSELDLLALTIGLLNP